MQALVDSLKGAEKEGIELNEEELKSLEGVAEKPPKKKKLSQAMKKAWERRKKGGDI